MQVNVLNVGVILGLFGEDLEEPVPESHVAELVDNT